jgi:hypothetical protein
VFYISVAATPTPTPRLQASTPRLVRCIELHSPRVHPSAQGTSAIPDSERQHIHRELHVVSVEMPLTLIVDKPKDFKPFGPPNLSQSTSAAFFSLISLAHQISPQSPVEVTLFLFPGPYHPSNPPHDLMSTVESLNESDDLWSRGLTKSVHEVLSEGKHEWRLEGKGSGSYSQEKRRPQVEGSMYI